MLGSESSNSKGETRSEALLGAALLLHSCGWSVIPIGRDKKPALPSWSEYQKRSPTEAELRRMFNRSGVTGLAVICGPASGDLTVRDFDSAGAYHAWAEKHPDLADRLLPSTSWPLIRNSDSNE